MTYANTQTIKILVVAQGWDDMPKTVVPTVAATAFKPRRSSGDIQFIVGYQNFLGCNLEEVRHGRHGLAAAVHESGGNQQAQIMPGETDSPGKT